MAGLFRKSFGTEPEMFTGIYTHTPLSPKNLNLTNSRSALGITPQH